MPAFMTHPSVRVKGTENNYDPMLCEHTNCPKHDDHACHMHCPFCVKTETFFDPLILRAHYRVKHVDKGLDFAGLKILRCCDQCEVMGSIKGEKKFRVPHWHCYCCRNGFNRRDEALKHFRTHFKNPQTTFQIQVVQEVNSMLNNLNTTEETVTIVDEVGQEIYYDRNSSSPDEHTQCVVGVTEAESEPVLIEDQGLDEVKDLTCQVFKCEPEPPYNEAQDQQLQLKQHVASLELRLGNMESLIAENSTLKRENDRLQSQVLSLSAELEKCQNASKVRHSQRIDSLLDELQNKHKDLLHEQLLQIRNEGHAPSHKRDGVLTKTTSKHNGDNNCLQEPPCKLTKPHIVHPDDNV